MAKRREVTLIPGGGHQTGRVYGVGRGLARETLGKRAGRNDDVSFVRSRAGYIQPTGVAKFQTKVLLPRQNEALIVKTRYYSRMSSKKCSFGVVGEPGKRGVAWSLKVHEKASGEVESYLYARAIGGQLKTSFHHSGKCHSGLTVSYHDALKRTDESISSRRHLVEWWVERDVDKGVTVPYHIVTPHKAVMQRSTASLPRGFVKVPAPRPNHSRLTSIFFFEPGASARLHGEGLIQVCDFLLGDGRALCIFTAEIPTPPLPRPNGPVPFIRTSKTRPKSEQTLAAIAHPEMDGWGFRARAVVELPVRLKTSKP